MQIKNTFLKGRINKDTDERLLPNGEYTHAENVRIVSPDGANSGAVKFPFSTLQLTSLGLPAGSKAIGSTVDLDSDHIYYLVWSPDGSGRLIEHNTVTGLTEIVLEDTRSTPNNVLNLQEDSNPVEMAVLNDSENNKKFMFITDNFNEPKYFEIEQAKGFVDSAFQEFQVTLIKRPPLSAPNITLSSGASENNIEQKFLSFAYRYVYKNGEKSALSPFSNHAFLPKFFNGYDYDTSTNESMVNSFNSVLITFTEAANTDVERREIVYKEYGSSFVYLIGSYETSESLITFANDKTYAQLPADQLTRFFDNVPKRAKGLALIGNRAVFGNYTENYDIERGGTPIIPDFNLVSINEVQPVGTAYNTVKSNRSYELGIAYVDRNGRITTPFTSVDNTTFIDNDDADKRNRLRVVIDSLAPEFATGYRFFLRDNGNSFYTIASEVLYIDGFTKWFKINQDDNNKIAVDEFIYFKSDSTGLQTEAVRKKILAIEQQPVNFLGGGEDAGLYFQVKGIGIDNASTETVFETIPENIEGSVYFELSDTYDVSPEGYHLGNFGDTDQSLGSSGLITLNYYNSFGWGNSFESNTILDSFNNPQMILSSRPSTYIEDYKEINRKASLTYGGVYENTTGYNSLNEFNLSNSNFKDMDTAYGSIQKLHSKDTDLYVFQENKTHRVLYQKDVLFDADGQGNIRESEKILGQEVPFLGEYGISKNPESFAFYGNRIYHLDKNRGAIMRLGNDGYTEISKNGLFDHIRRMCKDNTQLLHFGGYDPYDDTYVLNIYDSGTTANTLIYNERSKGFTSFYSFVPEAIQYIKNRMYSIKDGELYEHSKEDGTRNSFYGVPYTSKISLVVNNDPSDIKVFKNISQEGTDPWNVTLRSLDSDEKDFRQSTIDSSEFLKKEGKWFSYVRRNEIVSDAAGKAVYGVGEVISVLGNTVTIASEGSTLVCEGDTLYQSNGTSIGSVTDYTIDGDITISFAVLTAPPVGTFIYGEKSSRIEGSQMRGYVAAIDLDITTDEDKELYAVNTEVFKSYQ